MTDKAAKDNEKLIAFWNRAMALSEEEKARTEAPEPDAWKEIAPSEKLFLAAVSLGRRKKVLDYGCGSGWAGIIAAKSGCPDVTAADPAPGAAESTAFYAEQFGVSDRVHTLCIPPDWLKHVPDGRFDGFICSNVLDVVPPETAEEILQEAARVVTRDAAVIIGLNYYLSPEAAAEKGLELTDGTRLYVDGVLRLVSRTDEEWEKIFSPWFAAEKLEHFAWPGEAAERRRLFYLKRI